MEALQLPTLALKSALLQAGTPAFQISQEALEDLSNLAGLLWTRSSLSVEP